MLAQNIVSVTDTAFLGRVGEVELGASALGGVFYFTLYMVGFGFAGGAQILIGRRNGERDFSQIGRLFYHTIYFLEFLGLLLSFIYLFTGPAILKLMISSDAVFEATDSYLSYRIWGIFFAFITISFRSFYVGITKTRVLGTASVILAVVNIILDYVLIFGRLGFPEMGIAGAALASTIAEGISCLYFIFALYTRKENRLYNILKFPTVSWSMIRQIWNLSIYMMIQSFASVGVWFGFFMIIEQTGEQPLAVSNIIRSFYMLITMPLWAFHTATNTLVSNAMGEGKTESVIPIAFKVTKFSFYVTLVSSAVVCLIPEYIIKIYTTDKELINEAIPIVYLISAAILFWSVLHNFYSVISGSGNTRTSLFIELITLGFYMAYVYVVAIAFRSSLLWIWSAEIVYIIILGGISILYLKTGKWKYKQI